MGPYYLVAGLFTFSVILNVFTGEVYTAIQLSLATIVLWMWAYLLERRDE